MARRGTRDLDKERFWRRMLQLWRRAGRPSVRGFCSEHELAEPSFYSWRRLIAERDHEHRTTRPARPERPLFVPLNVAPPAPTAASTPVVLEVVLSSGQVVRVPAGFDAATLRQLLAVLGETPIC